MPSDNLRQWLGENGFDPEQWDSPGRYEDTPLILACRRGEKAIVEQLLAAGANVHHRNMDGTNALWASVVADSMEIADSLFAAGVDIDNQNDNGATVLMYAASSGKTPWVRYLLDKGADTSPRTLDDYSALDLASNIDILVMLRKAG